ncbi:MAG TPA: SpoIIE family protein phosphatase [Bacteroidales bacterium]|nr:SpoIIE family protein phosphatase [Bacteroidales bacterium]
MSTFKLNSLLEITLAINENLPVTELLHKYEKILKEELQIGKIIIFKLNAGWECILNSGFDDSLACEDGIDKKLLTIREISPSSVLPEKISDEVDIIIPVFHKDNPIAFVLIGDIDEESEGMSPIIKHLRFIQTISNILIVAIENIRLYNENLRQVAIQRELELASKMQTMLIPEEDKLPSNKHLGFRAFYHPHFEVGGDYYDVVELSDDQVGFCIADVSGKGISAAILMSNFQANLRALFNHGRELEDIVIKLNDRVMQSAKGEKFITLFLARYTYSTHRLEYINAGHNPPLLYNVQKKKLIQLTSGSVGMGMLEKLPFINKDAFDITGPSKMLLYTDGLVELIEDEGVEFGTTFIEQEISNSGSINENINEIIRLQRIEEGSASIFDDISILGLSFSGE